MKLAEGWKLHYYLTSVVMQYAPVSVQSNSLYCVPRQNTNTKLFSAFNLKFLTSRDINGYHRSIKGGLTKYRGYIGSTSIPSGRVIILNIVFCLFMLQNAFEKIQLYYIGYHNLRCLGWIDCQPVFLWKLGNGIRGDGFRLERMGARQEYTNPLSSILYRPSELMPRVKGFWYPGVRGTQ